MGTISGRGGSGVVMLKVGGISMIGSLGSNSFLEVFNILLKLESVL